MDCLVAVGTNLAYSVKAMIIEAFVAKDSASANLVCSTTSITVKVLAIIDSMVKSDSTTTVTAEASYFAATCLCPMD